MDKNQISEINRKLILGASSHTIINTAFYSVTKSLEGTILLTELFRITTKQCDWIIQSEKEIYNNTFLNKQDYLKAKSNLMELGILLVKIDGSQVTYYKIDGNRLAELLLEGDA